ncbi:hypothetical protein ANCDUO_19318 [Ancylostoma duodenale]|uniref:Uncharacterized protein n=1 Tax=Ancylostoma duodenale TaxID=51022 RepID=A0A0C2G0J2_9BILA|nr:hypothetical protein ANCDUO_19318 [Ancylostoma duodenale]
MSTTEVRTIFGENRIRLGGDGDRTVHIPGVSARLPGRLTRDQFRWISALDLFGTTPTCRTYQ